MGNLNCGGHIRHSESYGQRNELWRRLWAMARRLPSWHQGLEVTLAGGDRLWAPVAVWAGTYPPLELNDLRLVHGADL